MNEKYVSVTELNALKTKSVYHDEVVVNWSDIQISINNAKPMIAIEDIRKQVSRTEEVPAYAIIATIKKMINPQPEKHGGLTIEQWEQLKKHPFVTIILTGFDAKVMFLDDYQGEYDDGIKLQPDPENMTRTDLDLPDGIEIEVTNNNGSKDIITTPFKSTLQTIMKHYRLLGVAEDE